MREAGRPGVRNLFHHVKGGRGCRSGPFPFGHTERRAKCCPGYDEGETREAVQAGSIVQFPLRGVNGVL